MAFLRTILACVLLLTGVLRPVAAEADAWEVRVEGRISEAAEASLVRLAAASDGRVSLLGRSRPLRLRVGDWADLGETLAEWARTHGVDLPARRPAGQTAIAAAVATTTVDSVARPAPTDQPAFLDAADDARPQRWAWTRQTLSPPHRPAPLADRFAWRAPPAG